MIIFRFQTLCGRVCQLSRPRPHVSFIFQLSWTDPNHLIITMSSYVKNSWRSYQENKAARKRSEEIDRKLKLQQVWERSNTHNQILLFGKNSSYMSSHLLCHHASPLHREHSWEYWQLHWENASGTKESFLCLFNGVLADRATCDGYVEA